MYCSIWYGLWENRRHASASLLLAKATDGHQLGLRRLETTADEKGDAIVVVNGIYV